MRIRCHFFAILCRHLMAWSLLVFLFSMVKSFLVDLFFLQFWRAMPHLMHGRTLRRTYSICLCQTISQGLWQEFCLKAQIKEKFPESLCRCSQKRVFTNGHLCVFIRFTSSNSVFWLVYVHPLSSRNVQWEWGLAHWRHPSTLVR